MPKSYLDLLDNNKKWVQETLALDPDYFNELAKGQKPEFLWIGCSDSRVPANIITGTRSGDVFVHRNIANMVVHTDMNMLSVLQYAVDILKVKHVIVCGHYDCGGVKAALTDDSFGLIDNWLRHIKDVYRLHEEEMKDITDTVQSQRRMVELTVMEQVNNLSRTSVIQDAWKRDSLPLLHGWVYDIKDGLIRDMKVTKGPQQLEELYLNK
jgi:carbonic anhydrase